VDREISAMQICPGCEAEFFVGGYHSGGYMDEEFCSQDCHDNTMERRQERQVERA
jgi:hypothetical protein